MMWMCFLFRPLSVINWQLKIWSINWQRISPKRDPWLGVFRSTLEYLGVPKKHVVWNVDVAVYLSTTRNCREWLWLWFQSLKYHYAYVRFTEQHHDPIGDRPTSRVSAIIPSWKKCAPAVLNHSRKKKRENNAQSPINMLGYTDSYHPLLLLKQYIGRYHCIGLVLLLLMLNSAKQCWPQMSKHVMYSYDKWRIPGFHL